LSERADVLRHFLVLGQDWPYEYPGRDDFVASGPIAYALNGTRVKAVGGSSLAWGGLSQRLHPSDFEAASRFAVGVDWPIRYDDLEPYYAAAERELGVAGDAPSSPIPRSGGYPLPAFPDDVSDHVWRDAAARLGARVEPAPYAKNTVPYDGRPACQTFSTCRVCPIGAQYSADIHIARAEATGRCQVLTETVARRIRTDASGAARAVWCSRLDGSEVEIGARTIVVAAHAVESARLLLLSSLGNADHVGRYLMEHWYVGGRGMSDRRSFPGRIGFHTLESSHYYDRGRAGSGAVKLEFTTAGEPLARLLADDALWGPALAEWDCEQFGHWNTVVAETEHLPNPESRVTLDPGATDLFGDPVPNVHFALSETDRRTRERAGVAIGEFLEAVRARDVITRIDRPSPAAHHMGTCRMSRVAADGVVNPDLQVWGVPGLFVLGGAVFPTGGAVQPTLTIAALALRLADHLRAASL
jgi:choline dehydrogenase-like flavoprotein